MAGNGINYLRSFILPDEDPLNLYLRSDGALRLQDVNNSPSSLSTVFTAQPGLLAQSVTSDTREYIAFTDGRVGMDIPRRISADKTWQRFTQDGPAVGPVAEDYSETVDITSITPLPPVAIETAINNDGVITITTATPHGLLPGDDFLISGNSQFQYNGPDTVATVPSPTTLTYDSVGSGWPEGVGGELIPSRVTVVLASPYDVIQGDFLTISGNSDSNYNTSQNAVSSLTVGLASAPVCTVYPYDDSNGGCFNYTYPGDGFNEPLPGPVSTVTLPSNYSLFFNPNGPLMGTNLPGAPSENNPPLLAMGVTPAGMWDGTTLSVSPINFDFAMTVIFNLSFGAAGSYTFQIVHKEGVRLGMGGGIVQVSGPLNEAQDSPTKTAKLGLPTMYANNGSTEYYHVSVFNSQFTVAVPSPGTYPVEIDYCQWHHSNPGLVLLYSTPSAAPWLSTVTYSVGNTVSVSGTNYIATAPSLNQSPPNATYWAVLPPFISIQPGAATFGTPPNWVVESVIDGVTFTFEAVYAVGIGTGGTADIGGLITPGRHQVAESWLLDDDTITRPSPPVSWTAAGNKRVKLTSCAIGPSNVKGRVFSFSGSGGDNFFYLIVPATAPAFPPATGVAQVSTSTTLLDNVSDSAIFDFSDDTLFAGDAADVTGNDLFGQVTLGLVANLVQYSNRVGAIGNTNKVENLLAMGFEGGTLVATPTVPLGWDLSANVGGTLVASPLGWGFAWQDTGNGTTAKIGLISQNAYEDATSFAPILSGDTAYTMQFYAKAGQAHTTGTLNFSFTSVMTGLDITASIPWADISTAGGWYTATFSGMTPDMIPQDAIFSRWSQGLAVGQTGIYDEGMVVYTEEPVNMSAAILFSYAFNNGAFHGVTGLLETEYPEPTRDGKILRDNFYIAQSKHLVRTKDNGIGEPSTWPVSTVSDKTGALSIRAFDTGEGWVVFGSEAGLYMAAGGEPQKISQEIQTLWSAIDPNLYNLVQVVNDLENRRIYVTVPLTAYKPTGNTFSPASCNKMLVVDYRELNTSTQIENAPPLHISMTGKMLSSDLTRKWSVWNIPCNSMAIMSLPGVNPQIVFGSGLGTGLTDGFDNAYSLSDLLTADDDYGTIGSYNGESPLSYKQWLLSGPPTPAFPNGTKPTTGTYRPQTSYYMTYLLPSHEQEQQLQIGSQRKLYEYLEVAATGVGSLYMLPFINQIDNSTVRPAAPRDLSQGVVWDLEWPLNVKAQRMAILFYPSPTGVIPANVVITISPTSASVHTFDTQQFTYTLSGTPTLDVTWSTSGGSVTDEGLYTAPGTANTYTVTVTSVDDPSASATATVTVHGGYDGD